MLTMKRDRSHGDPPTQGIARRDSSPGWRSRYPRGRCIRADRIGENAMPLFYVATVLGLAAADGVVQWCVENKRGLELASAIVPVVGAAVVFDSIGPDNPRPGPTAGRMAVRQRPTRTGLWPHRGR